MRWVSQSISVNKWELMGGQGSGRYYRSSNVTTVEETKRIDIRYMRRHNLLKPNYTGSLQWTRSDGSSSGDIRYSCYQSHIIFHYRFRYLGTADWEAVDLVVWFDFTPCNIGGVRQWFICPACKKRCEILCLADKWPACRKCYRLPYQSQLEDRLGRLQLKQTKLENMLWGKDRKWWRKAKREQLFSQYEAVSMEWERGFALYAESLWVELLRR